MDFVKKIDNQLFYNAVSTFIQDESEYKKLFPSDITMEQIETHFNIWKNSKQSYFIFKKNDDNEVINDFLLTSSLQNIENSLIILPSDYYANNIDLLKNDNFKMENSIIHLKKVNKIDDSSKILIKNSTIDKFNNLNFKGNIIIEDSLLSIFSNVKNFKQISLENTIIKNSTIAQNFLFFKDSKIQSSEIKGAFFYIDMNIKIKLNINDSKLISVNFMESQNDTKYTFNDSKLISVNFMESQNDTKYTFNDCELHFSSFLPSEIDFELKDKKGRDLLFKGNIDVTTKVNTFFSDIKKAIKNERKNDFSNDDLKIVCSGDDIVMVYLHDNLIRVTGVSDYQSSERIIEFNVSSEILDIFAPFDTFSQILIVNNKNGFNTDRFTRYSLLKKSDKDSGVSYDFITYKNDNYFVSQFNIQKLEKYKFNQHISDTKIKEIEKNLNFNFYFNIVSFDGYIYLVNDLGNSVKKNSIYLGKLENQILRNKILINDDIINVSLEDIIDTINDGKFFSLFDFAVLNDILFRDKLNLVRNTVETNNSNIILDNGNIFNSDNNFYETFRNTILDEMIDFFPIKGFDISKLNNKVKLIGKYDSDILSDYVATYSFDDLTFSHNYNCIISRDIMILHNFPYNIEEITVMRLFPIS